MTDSLTTPCTAFAGLQKIASGPLVDVALAIKALASAVPVLVFDDRTGRVIDLDLRGTTAEIIARLDAQGQASANTQRPAGDGGRAPRGRPRLGVVAREVTLLPRHWEWLAAQPGGASQALRRLVDDARRAAGGESETAKRQERAYRFLSALAGDFPGFEEAIRALFAEQPGPFAARMADWPTDIRAYALDLAWGAPEGDQQ